MKAKILTLIFAMATTIAINAQNPRVILDKASDAYNKAGGITASFTIDTKDTKSKQTYSYDGKAQMKGNKFKLDIPDGTTWFDGKTQWVYVKDSEEVNVSNPTGEELQAVSPAALFSLYKTGYKLVYKGEKRANGKTVMEVELTAQKKGADLSKISVQIDKATNIFTTITMTSKSGLQNTLTIKKIQTGVNLSDATFVFNKRDYPKAEIIDLR